MRLCKITDTLYVNPERVVSVEQRTIDNGDKGLYTFTELTLETMVRWRIDIPLADVVFALDAMLTDRRPVEYR